MDTAPKPYPKEFRDDVVRVARNREPGQKLEQITADFSISESCLANWMKTADIEDGISAGTTAADNAELRQARKGRMHSMFIALQHKSVVRRSSVRCRWSWRLPSPVPEPHRPPTTPTGKRNWPR
ncbi:hypothetical protein K8O92_04180 [Nocardia asteroides]|nr:hypothetical protein K8O92_04180 [Nocardia asteroides]